MSDWLRDEVGIDVRRRDSPAGRSLKGILRRLRGALGNAVVWGASWFSVFVALLGAATLAGVIQVADPWRFVLLVSANVGVTGLLTGAAFSMYPVSSTGTAAFWT